MKPQNPAKYFAPARLLFAIASLCLSLLCASAALPGSAQTQAFNREQANVILDRAKSDLKEHYYDPTFRGFDLEARFVAAAEKLKQATSNSQAYGIIAQALLDLNDSHTFLIPPGRAVRVEYGWNMQMVGNLCLVTAVKPGSDAEKKGLKVGDAVLSIDGFQPTRKNLWKMKYSYYTLKPRPGMRLLVQGPDGKDREIDVLAKAQQRPQITDLVSGGYDEIHNMILEEEGENRLLRQRYFEAGNDLLIWKMPQFSQTKSEVDDSINKARKRRTLIIDLRGNSGGYEETLLRLTGSVFDRDIQLGELKRRKETKPMIAKTVGERAFKGQLIVLVDSESSSAAELFARVVQLEKRGTVIGDRTAGAVMRSRVYGHQLGVDIVAFYGVSVTDADIIMADGKSLERVGVTPDEERLPKMEDLAGGRDPVLSRAAELAGVKLEPEKAGALFPVEWRK
jgi:C-terminal processing protease CtpA/Prc